VKVAEENGEDANESIRVVNDALSCADNLEFIGQTTQRKINKRDPANPVTLPFCTMPVKLDFPDRNTRIHFEKTLRKHCGMKATISLPFQVRRYQALFLDALRDRYKGRVITARPDTSTLSMVAFMKNESDRGWLRCRETVPIPRGILLPGAVIPGLSSQWWSTPTGPMMMTPCWWRPPFLPSLSPSRFSMLGLLAYVLPTNSVLPLVNMTIVILQNIIMLYSSQRYIFHFCNSNRNIANNIPINDP
jgi:hypothetical protein